MKIPAVYSERVLMQTKEFWTSHLSEEYIERVKTPPYVSNTPQVIHHRIAGNRSSSSLLHGGASRSSDAALILCSDGLTDLYEDRNLDEEYYLKRWAAIIGESNVPPRQSLAPPSRPPSRAQNTSMQSPNSRNNLAIRLLRDAIGGNDLSRASANLTVEMEERWIDDTTIVVIKFT